MKLLDNWRTLSTISRNTDARYLDPAISSYVLLMNTVQKLSQCASPNFWHCTLHCVGLQFIWHEYPWKIIIPLCIQYFDHFKEGWLRAGTQMLVLEWHWIWAKLEQRISESMPISDSSFRASHHWVRRSDKGKFCLNMCNFCSQMMLPKSLAKSKQAR